MIVWGWFGFRDMKSIVNTPQKMLIVKMWGKGEKLKVVFYIYEVFIKLKKKSLDGSAG